MEEQTSESPLLVSGGLENRTNPRVGIDLQVEIYSGDFRGALGARTRDLGVGGVCVATESVISVRSITHVVIALPTGPLQVDVVGKWQTRAVADDAVLTGLQFVGPGEEAIGRLWDVLVERGKDLARFLYSGSDLSDFGLEEALGLAHVSRCRSLPAGTRIYGQDGGPEAEESIFLVQRGAVELEVRVRDAIRRSIGRLGPGRLFGGMPLVADEPDPETAVTDSAVELLEINRGAWRSLCVAKPWLAHRLAQAVTRVYARRARDLLLRVRDQL